MSEIKNKVLSLFQGFGVELEYMIVDKDSLNIKPIADLLLKELAGNVNDDFENGEIAWSNELVMHVLEIKTNGPATSLMGLSEKFNENVKLANIKLAKHNAILLPTGAHPFMNPLNETVIWPHEYNQVYALYDRIFDCKGHGWSNLQSTHLNLPFANDLEFEQLHAAIRLLLPIIPSISASTPILDSSFNGFKDHRLEYYRKNQAKIPAIAGKIIPEKAYNQKDYESLIFEPIRKAITPYDSEGVLGKYFLNSRGAIARFDRMAIEIRVIDIQECPKMDIAVLTLIIETIKWLIARQSQELKRQKAFDENELYEIFCGHAKTAEDTIIQNKEYLSIFGFNKPSCTSNELWKHIVDCVQLENDEVNLILEKGSLSTRILGRLSQDFSLENIKKVYRNLAHCLKENQAFEK